MAVGESLAAGCKWLHVDFQDGARSFHFEARGLSATKAGLIALSRASPATHGNCARC